MRQFVPKSGQWFSRSAVQKKSLDSKWLRFRKRALELYGRECMACGTTEGAMQVDHVKPKHVYRSLWYDINNVQILCKPCNMKKGMTTKDYRSAWVTKNSNNPKVQQLMKNFSVRLARSL